MTDLREEIFKGVKDNRIAAFVIADDHGILSGIHTAKEEAKKLGLSIENILEEGCQIKKGDEIAKISGTPLQIAMAEDILMGNISKPSGIATAAKRFVEKAEKTTKIVAGAWKKMPASLKEVIRKAVVTGGAYVRISPNSFVYLDKNYIRILGGIRKSLEAVAHLNGHEKVVQLKGKHEDIVSETRVAAQFDADILHVDTGKPDDVNKVVEELIRLGMREKVRIAYSGNVRLEDMDMLKTLDIDILDIGRQIVDAPLLDMRMEVIDV